MNLALLGKNITHSKSAEVYRNIIKGPLTYSLLDISTEKLIPSLDEIFNKDQLLGLNITSPYKPFFLEQVKLVNSFEIKKIGGINCIRKNEDGFYEGQNTDLLAVKSIINELLIKHDINEILILGSGVMAKMTTLVLKSMEIQFSSLSRGADGPLEYIDITPNTGANLMVINTCSRDFKYRGRVSSDVLFWDYNYEMPQHEKSIPYYIDGLSLLNCQAEHAVNFFINDLVLNT